MKYKAFFILIAIFFTNCAVYKQLAPEPELSSLEKGYLELKDEDEHFEIEKEDKYFVAFPGPKEKHFYLVLNIKQKDSISSFLTSSLIKKKTVGPQINDETHAPDSLSVYPITDSVQTYYWIINKVHPEETDLKLNYRYVPQWRFKFENKHTEFKSILKQNTVDRNIYNQIGKGYSFEKFNFPTAIDTMTDHLGKQEKVYQALLDIESIFPSSILNSKDVAYLDYLLLKKKLEDEIAFQKKYLATVHFLDKIQKSKGNPGVFLNHVEHFISYFSGTKGYPEHILKECRSILEAQLTTIPPYYDGLLAGKNDIEPFDAELYRLPVLKRIAQLYQASETKQSPDYDLQTSFLTDFDKKSLAVLSTQNTLNKIESSIKALPQMPKDGIFGKIVRELAELQAKLPNPLDATNGKYLEFSCAKALNKAIADLKKSLTEHYQKKNEADNIVRQVNALQAEKDYRAMLGILKDKKHLGFLLNKYKDLDLKSVSEQAKNIGEALQKYVWYKAESGLSQLHRDTNFLNPIKIKSLKDSVVYDLEDSLYIKVDNLTRYRVNQFCENKADTLVDIDSLYSDSVFLPAYDIKFSSGTKGQLIQRKEALVAHLAKLKENEFPAKAITLLYKEFMRAPHKKGVLKARAIVSHGKHYKGSDKKIKRRTWECDPWATKWITEPAKYRRVYAIPITTKKHGPNTYLVRTNIRIKSDAKFPVYDVNIKLPEEIAKNATSEQWYEKITLNKTPLKNEGRFTITAPNAENNYECQLSPVRMKKDESNYVDIYFKHNSFKPIPISVMAQKPIIKKH
ncbi:MAG: hypothetical protein HQK83_06665 [Fibrobacteria bacterium]|nr:hypothetical protein [Fibrobacteria bacterium]